MYEVFVSATKKITPVRDVILFTGLLLLSACSSGTVQLPSENYNSRVSIIVIHHTADNFDRSVAILTSPSSNPVSSHYLIPEPNDETYEQKKLEVYELVPETQRAWHAGQSYWLGKTGLNDQSIGIELVNQTHCQRPIKAEETPVEDESVKNLCFFPDFAESQIKVLLDLLGSIMERHPNIKPTNIIGHSDIAPDRKLDPGPRFPWQRLYQLGFGAWYDDETVAHYWEKFLDKPIPINNVQRALSSYGYTVEATGALDMQTKNALRAFQLHFNPSLVNSEPSVESAAILFALIKKYYPDQLEDLLYVAPEPGDMMDCTPYFEADAADQAVSPEPAQCSPRGCCR